MPTSILLGMDDATANIYRTTLMTNSNQLEVMDRSIPIFHTVIQALERYSPDIFYINIRAMEFDAKDMKSIEQEIVRIVYRIKENRQLSRIRIAIQANSQNSKAFLKKLAILNVWDIFYSIAGNTDLTVVANQLSQPATISNVASYLAYDTTGSVVQKVSEQPKPLKSVKDSKSNEDNRKKVINKDKKNQRLTQNSKVRKKSYRNKHKAKIFLILFSILLLIGLLLLLFNGMRKHSNTNNAIPTYKTLIQNKDYVSAAKYYPGKGIDTEDKMLSDSSIKDKGSIARKIEEYNSSDTIKFDNYYFTQDYEKAAKLYYTSNDKSLMALNNARRIMVAYTLMKNGEPEKAYSVGKSLNNDELNKRISAYKNFLDANKMLENKLKNHDLTGEDAKKARKQIEKNKEEMEEL